MGLLRPERLCHWSVCLNFHIKIINFSCKEANLIRSILLKALVSVKNS